ncbi:MAG: hypothetical protein LUE64_01370 [Candidatus Gastranaerophilales bacterium]|nr:hypothetical protein [Candidatus Gastranaerophilales bacterium]
MEKVYFLISVIEIVFTFFAVRFISGLIKKIENFPVEFDLSDFRQIAKILSQTSKIPLLLKFNPAKAIVSIINVFKTFNKIRRFFNTFG